MAELNLRTTTKNSITKIYNRISSCDLEECDATQLEQDLKSIGEHFKRFIVNHDALVSRATLEELDSHDELWEIVESNYNAACVLLNRQLRKITSKSKTPDMTPSANNVNIKLDPLAIPTFDGSLHNWLAFKDVFKTLVHDAKLPEAYKLARLRQSVDPIKVPLIGGMYTGGYHEVWESLTSRYDNKKLLAETHVSRFLNLKPATDETPKALLSIVDTVQESLRALRVMKLPVDSWDALVVPIVVSKLPISTQKKWSMSASSDEIPVLIDLLKFLEKRAHCLTTEQIRIPSRTEPAVSRKQRDHQPMKSHLATVDSESCLHCQGAHMLSRCQQFLAMKPDQRFETLKRINACFNCLKQGHAYRQCASSVCRRCGRKHHTTLCQQQEAQVTNSSKSSKQLNDEQTPSSKTPPSSSQTLGQKKL